MSTARRGATQVFGRLWNLANNALTILGAILTTISGLLIVTFLLVEMAGGIRNPYIAGFAYLLLPAIFVVGLVLIPVGMWRRHRKLLAAGATEGELDAYPKLDFNNPQLRKIATYIIVLTAVNAVILGASSYWGIEHMESVAFCGTTCHTVMQPEYTAYQQSAHSRVACVQCHIGPGASWFVRSKLDGLRQVWKTAVNTFHRPVGTPLRTLRPARETCEACHWPAKHYGDKLHAFARFAPDEANTATYNVMLIRTGGGTLDIGGHGGIHWWHIYSDNRIRYLQADERRQQMRWVELRTAKGEVTTFVRSGMQAPSDAELAQARVMDCIDCHNRPTHYFEVPRKAIDGVLERFPELRALPYLKREAQKAVTATYPTHEAGVAGVREALLAFYRTSYPELVKEKGALVERAAAAAAEVFARSTFPEMHTDWRTHPNNIGHPDPSGEHDDGFPGCFRCHDGEMSAAGGGRAIPGDCDTCHAFLVQDSPEQPDLTKLALK
jgi:hypothetical protein